ncbi:MAG TPA: RNA polymerase sigma factor [Kofleriaceae bacterium]|nr:RNA polymerase sigma factor [Kofleriaceae bacterium]
MLTAEQFGALYRQCAPLVQARARRIVGSEADDIVQEVFARLWRKPPAHGEFTPWLYQAITNACIDRLRQRARRDQAWMAQVAGLNAAVADVQSLEAKELCRRIIARADTRTQQIVALIYFDEFTHDEAAALLGISRKTVSERLDRFTQLARKAVHQWDRN